MLERPSLFIALTVGSCSRGAPRASLDAPEDLSKEALCQVAFGQLQDGVPGVLDKAAAGLEQPLMQARQRPAADGEPRLYAMTALPSLIPCSDGPRGL